jgi:hypothetical protein
MTASRLADRRKRVAAALSSMRSYLTPAIADDPALLADVGRHLRAGRLIVVREAFRPAFAERLHAALDGCAGWELHEDYAHAHFHYRHHNLYDERRFPPDLRWCVEILRSAETRAFIQALADRRCTGEAQFSASWYRPGDYSLPHTDLVGPPAARRKVAMVWHLTRDWQPGWGGEFYWCPTRQYVAPSFNTLLLFTVRSDSTHFVTAVAPHARGKRLAINGWWTGPAESPDGGDRRPGPELLGRYVEVV